ncbi:MAG: DUF4845 domain-containing protein [Proteobacteria bacterium]|nr:DUF4845 domain-containing protein [Pseudomonadota bacterium]
MMKNMRNKQHGIGFVGWSTILGVLAFFILIGLRLFPLYSEKLTVITAMEGVANQPNVANMNKSELRRLFTKNIDVQSNIERFNVKGGQKLINVVIDKKTKKKYLHVAYEGRNVFVKDLTLLLVFDHKVELTKSVGE